MEELIAAAKEEGELNVIALPADWANYGEIIKTFSEKYDIKVNSMNPDASSGDEINALKSTKGQDTAPDVVDVGNSYAISGALEGLFAPYQVATWDDIPDEQKDEGGLWYSDLGGYVSIGCDASQIEVPCPTTVAELNNPALKGAVALNGDPTSSNAAFMGLWAVALANGGSVDDISPGIDFFEELNDAGIFNPTDAKPQTVASGATPIVLDWDYLNVGQAAELEKDGITWTTNIPADGVASAFYAQAISINAPHPAAARLWQEYLYSQEPDGGQNLWLEGAARPVELEAMVENGTAIGADRLPEVPESEPFLPTPDQITEAQNLVIERWAAAVS